MQKQIIIIIFIYFISITNSLSSHKLNKEAKVARPKRFLSFFNEKTEQKYERCLLPGNYSGLCKPLYECFLSNLWEHTYQFTSTFCTTKNSYTPGACCPEELEKTAKIVEDPDIVSENEIDSADVENYLRTSQNQGCGISSIYKPKIVGGRPADPKEWPWMVALLRNRVDNFCGGVLFTRRHIVSAAHCTNGFKPRDITARLGEYDFGKIDESQSRDFRVVEIREHPDYNQDTYENDISILKIHRPTNYNDYIRPICLPSITYDFENKTATVTGWGTQGFGAAPSDTLMEVDVPIWGQERCVGAYPEREIKDTILCAGVSEGRKDSCQGDSGGPLMHKLPNGRWIAVGVVSWGLYCGLPNRPGLYTRVNQYLPWIVQNTIE